MQNSDLGQVGRVREGRVDTGVPVFQNIGMTSAELLRRALTNTGFGLDDLHWFTKKTPGKQDKHVVNAVYTAVNAEVAEYNRATEEALRELGRMQWYCHIWLNPNGVLTINFVGLQNGEPKNQLTVRDRHIALFSLADGSVTLGASLADVNAILVKFFFTNTKRIPAGIRRLERASDAEMDRRHAEEAAKR